MASKRVRRPREDGRVLERPGGESGDEASGVKGVFIVGAGGGGGGGEVGGDEKKRRVVGLEKEEVVFLSVPFFDDAAAGGALRHVAAGSGGGASTLGAGTVGAADKEHLRRHREPIEAERKFLSVSGDSIWVFRVSGERVD